MHYKQILVWVFLTSFIPSFGAINAYACRSNRTSTSFVDRLREKVQSSPIRCPIIKTCQWVGEVEALEEHSQEHPGRIVESIIANLAIRIHQDELVRHSVLFSRKESMLLQVTTQFERGSNLLKIGIEIYSTNPDFEEQALEVQVVQPIEDLASSPRLLAVSHLDCSKQTNREAAFFKLKTPTGLPLRDQKHPYFEIRIRNPSTLMNTTPESPANLWVSTPPSGRYSPTEHAWQSLSHEDQE